MLSLPALFRCSGFSDFLAPAVRSSRQARLRVCAACSILAISLLACSAPGGVHAVDAGSSDIPLADQEVADSVAYHMTDVTSPDAAPWPTGTDTSLPNCAPWSDAWALPDVATAKLDNAKGDLKLEASADLQPIGYEETVTVTVRNAKGKKDKTVAATLKIKVDPGVQVVKTQQVKAGVAQLVLKVTQLGAQLVTVTLADGRAGQIKLWGFQTQLPVWRIDVDPADLAKIYATPNVNVWVPATLTVGGETHTGKMRLHGGSSRTYTKKSFRLNLDKDQRLADGRRKLILRAEYVDKSQVRSFVAYEVLRHGTWLPASRLSFVHLRLGARYHGVMLQPERVDGHFLTDHGLQPKGSLYEADPDFEKSVPGGNLTPVTPPTDYPLVYQQHEGSLNYTDLIELIEVVLQLPDAEFEANVDRVIKVDDVLVFLAFSAVIQNQDWVRKNYYLYRDNTAVDSRWTLIPWDLDLSLGHLWSPEHGVLGEEIFIDGNPYIGVNTGTLFFNQLADRLLHVEHFRQRYRSFVAHLLTKSFDNTFLAPRVNNTLCRMQPDLLADRLKRAKNAELLSRVQEVRDFVDGRRTWLKTWLSEADSYGQKK